MSTRTRCALLETPSTCLYLSLLEQYGPSGSSPYLILMKPPSLAKKSLSALTMSHPGKTDRTLSIQSTPSDRVTVLRDGPLPSVHVAYADPDYATMITQIGLDRTVTYTVKDGGVVTSVKIQNTCRKTWIRYDFTFDDSGYLCMEVTATTSQGHNWSFLKISTENFIHFIVQVQDMHDSEPWTLEYGHFNNLSMTEETLQP